MLQVIFFFLGLIIGSFLNVVDFRFFAEGKFWKGRSRCPKCKKSIRWYDNVPLLSFAWLKGHCRDCQQKISWQYPLVEFITGLFFMLFALKFGFSAQTILYCIISCFLILIFLADAKHQVVPDAYSLPAIVLVLLYNLIFNLSNWNSWLIGAAVGAGFFALQHLISRGKWIGTGDILIGLLIGLLLGWPMIWLALVVAYIAGAVVSINLLIAKTQFPWIQIPPGLLILLF